MADYTPQQKLFIAKMNNVDKQHQAAAQNRNASTAPYATGGKVQAGTKPRTVKVKAGKPHTRTLPPKAPTGGVAAPAAPVNPDQSLINAAVRLRYAPQDQALTQGLQDNARFSSGVGDWYKNALDEIRGLQTGQNAAAQQTLGQITAYNSPATLANPNDQQAANARNNLNAEFASQFGQNAASNDAAMARLAAAYGSQQGNTLNQANVERQRLLASQGALGAQKADYATTYGGQLAQAEQKQANSDRTYNLQSTVAQNANLIKKGQLTVQKTLAQSLTTDRTNKQKIARTNARTKQKALEEKTTTDAQALQIKTDAANTKATGDSLKRSQFKAKYGLTPEKVATMSPGQLSHFAAQNPQFEGYARPPVSAKAKPLTQGQAKGRQAILDSIVHYQTDVKHGVPLHKTAADGRKNKVNEAVLHAGADAVSHGYITPATVQLLEQIGYTVPKEWTRKGAFPVTYKAK